MKLHSVPKKPQDNSFGRIGHDIENHPGLLCPFTLAERLGRLDHLI